MWVRATSSYTERRRDRKAKANQTRILFHSTAHLSNFNGDFSFLFTVRYAYYPMRFKIGCARSAKAKQKRQLTNASRSRELNSLRWFPYVRTESGFVHSQRFVCLFLHFMMSNQSSNVAIMSADEFYRGGNGNRRRVINRFQFITNIPRLYSSNLSSIIGPWLPQSFRGTVIILIRGEETSRNEEFFFWLFEPH